jgi:hypothetical protein
MTRRRAAARDVPLAADSPIRRRACAIADGLRYRNRSGGRNGLFELSGLHRRTGLPCVLQTIADQASGQSSGGYPSPGSPSRAKRLPAACGQSHGGGGPDGSGRRAFAHGIRPLPGMFLPSSVVRSITPDRDVDRPARSSSSAKCREDASIARIHGDRHRHSAREALRCVAPDESHRKKGTLLQEPWTKVPFFRTWLRGVGQAWPAPHPPPPCRQVRSG